MGTRVQREGAERVYQVAHSWVDTALRSDDSLFTPGQPIWTPSYFEELLVRFLNRPDRSRRKFTDKLRDQLDGGPPEAFQLLGEAFYFSLLITSTKAETKKKNITDVLGLSSTPVPIPDHLVQSLAPGLIVVNPGQYFHRQCPFQVGFVLEFATQWKKLGIGEQKQLLGEPWYFKEFITGFQPVSRMLQEVPGSFRAQKEALLHLVFPDIF